VTAVLFFGEIIPSAIFTGPRQLDIAAGFANFLWMVLYVLGPIAYPIAWVLDRLVPEEETTMSRNEVRALVEIHREIAQEVGIVEPFNEDEEDMVRGALSLSLMKADNADILKPRERVFTLPLNGVMDEETMNLILEMGYSRVPIEHPGGVLIGYFMVKQLILLDPKAKTPISKLERYKVSVCNIF
jgi:metal transporter CNNM